MQRKRLEDMNLLDDFLFNAVMTFPGIGERFCRLLLQVVLGREIGRLRVVAQRVFGGRDEEFRGARLDVLAEEDLMDVLADPAVFDIEPDNNGDVVSLKDLPKRVRFYHAIIDSRCLKKGEGFGKLKRVFVIFVCSYDPFDRGRMVYTIRNMCEEVPEEVYASCLLAGYVGAVLLHLPTDGMPAFGEYSRMLPEGLRLFATYVMAHHTYLNGEIWSAYGMGKAALFMADRSYPISMTYIHCMMAVCAINRKHKQEAQEEMLRSWELAKMDGFLEPFIEHHGLLRGLIEACIRNRDPEAYQRITEGVISFSRGWMALHNPENRRKVTGELSTMEFSIAMLASGGWTNKEIGEHLGISINTVKHYLTDIFCKLNVKKRDELKKFMLK